MFSSKWGFDAEANVRTSVVEELTWRPNVRLNLSECLKVMQELCLKIFMSMTRFSLDLELMIDFVIDLESEHMDEYSESLTT